MPLAADFPSWLRPEIIPGLPFRWYGLMYIFAFAAAFLLYRRQIRERKFPLGEDALYSLFTWAIIGLLLGARIFSALVYDSAGHYLARPWLIFWPFSGGRFVGLQGMSFHGGAIGASVAIILFCKLRRLCFREIGDMFAAAIPLGYTFGRLGNFINGELYGRVTSGTFGIIFPDARRFPATEDWVLRAAERAGVFAVNGTVNLPRHPSQLYEAVLEGIVLWAVIWFFRNRKPFNGFLIGLYFLGYGALRFLIEYFREPDAHIGFIIELGRTGLPANVRPLLSFSAGQLLCFAMIVFGAVWLIVASRMPGREPIRVYPDGASADGNGRKPAKSTEEKASERNKRRNFRKKLK